MNQKPTMLEKAQIAWNGNVPDWVEELARLATHQGLNVCAERLNYSGAAVSNTINNKYRGDLGKIEETVRGALMHETVNCPVVGDIGRDQCLRHQAAKRAHTNSIRTRLYRACRNGCPHSRLKNTGGRDA
jgi:hypothetical protein